MQILRRTEQELEEQQFSKQKDRVKTEANLNKKESNEAMPPLTQKSAIVTPPKQENSCTDLGKETNK
jgi:hypothetical protein